MSLIGCYIPVHEKLTQFLPMVIDNIRFSAHKVSKGFCDFTKTPENVVRNQGLKFFPNCDFIWTIDADEIILPEDQQKILKYMLKHPDRDGVMCPVIDYIDLSLEYILPKREHTAIVFVKPHVFFYETRCVHANIEILKDVKLHHFGYAFPFEINQWKENHYWDKKEAFKERIKEKPIKIPVNQNLKKILAKYF